MSTPLNPLHSTEWLIEQIQNTGCYPDVTRRTGRSTAQALRAIAKAIDEPGKRILLRDHHGTSAADRELCHATAALIQKMQLQHLWVNMSDHSLIFQRK